MGGITMKNIPIVAGLIMRMRTTDGNHSFIGGPALYAAIGMRCMKVTSRIMAALGRDLTDKEKEIIQFFTYDDTCIEYVRHNTMNWLSSSILGNKRNGKTDGMPNLWRTENNFTKVNDSVLVLANADPEWYRKILENYQPQITLMDFNINWLSIRTLDLISCLKRVDIVTITQYEFNSLDKSIFQHFDLNKNKYLLIKDGEKGTRLISKEREEMLEPANPKYVHTDIGCGDLLIGLLGGYIHNSVTSAHELSFELIKNAYLNALPFITKLLESTNNEEFIQRILNDFKK